MINLPYLPLIFSVGRCKSTYHQFLFEIMEKVRLKAAAKGMQPRTVFLPHCTWDKLGEIMANAGGRCMGLFDELLSFFSTMNMYSSVKMQVSDTKEYQDFLQMYTGKAKTRETSKFPVIKIHLLQQKLIYVCHCIKLKRLCAR